MSHGATEVGHGRTAEPSFAIWLGALEKERTSLCLKIVWPVGPALTIEKNVALVRRLEHIERRAMRLAILPSCDNLSWSHRSR